MYERACLTGIRCNEIWIVLRSTCAVIDAAVLNRVEKDIAPADGIITSQCRRALFMNSLKGGRGKALLIAFMAKMK